MSCSICCCEDGTRRCASLDCAWRICVECLDRYVALCCREHNVPRCLGEGCSALILRPQCRAFVVYDRALLRGLLRDPHLDERSRKEEMRQALFREREAFLERSFPESIRRAVKILYAPELRRVLKSNLENAHPPKKCFRVFCKGTMTLQSPAWKCARCESRFCEQCEMRYEDRHHTCRAEDRATVVWKSALPTCPKCGVAIEKSEGCDFMTCAVCQQNFSYTTGEATTAGNHGKSIPVVLLNNEGPEKLWTLLLRGRPRHELSPIQEALARELEDLETLSFFPVHDTGEWKTSDIPALVRSSVDHHHALDDKTARAVALRVEKLETKKQHTRHVWRRLRHLEDEILQS